MIITHLATFCASGWARIKGGMLVTTSLLLAGGVFPGYADDLPVRVSSGDDTTLTILGTQIGNVDLVGNMRNKELGHAGAMQTTQYAVILWDENKSGTLPTRPSPGNGERDSNTGSGNNNN